MEEQQIVLRPLRPTGHQITITVTVPGEELTPALAVTPLVQSWGEIGPLVIPDQWRITHTPTGMALCAPCCRACATAVGLALASLPIPWGALTGAPEELEQLPEAPRLRNATRLITATATHCTHADPDEEGTSG